MPGNVETIILRILGDSKSGEQTLDKMHKRLLKFGATLTAVSDAALVAFAKLGEGGAKIEDLESKFDHMARAFGRSADDMLGEWDRAAAGTVDRAMLMQKANQAALLGLPVDRLADMLTIARNAAMATGESVEYMFNSLVVGVARKSRAVLDNLGIIIDAEDAYAAYAKKIGAQSAQHLTAAQQQMAFLEAAFSAAGRQAQILGGVTETNATIIARARAKWKDMTSTIQKAFVPVAAAAARIVIGLANAFEKIPAPVIELVAKLLTAAAAIGAVVGPVLMLVGVWPLISGFLATISGAIGSILPIIAAVVAALAVLGAVIALLRKAWTENWGGIRTAVQKFIRDVWPYVTRIVRQVQTYANIIKVQLMALVDAIRVALGPALEWLADKLGDTKGFRGFLRFLSDFVGVVLGTVAKLIESLRLLLQGRGEDAFEPLKDAALNIVTLIVIGWQKYISKAVTWGWNLIVNFANGIIRAAKTVLAKAATWIGNILGGFLKPGSPPKKGPLRGIIKWGKGLMDTYFKAFGKADFGILTDVLSPMREALESAVSLGDIDQETMLKTFRALREQSAELIANFRETGVISDEMLGGIADRLGEGGEEYAKYLRLTLEHEQALNRLASIEDEVAAAEARGFVPAALKDKLAAAQAEVDAKAEAVDWQREYLAALQDGVNLQAEMIAAMKELTEAMGGGGEGETLADQMGDIGAGGGIGDQIEDVFTGLTGGFSKEFEETKGKVKEWFETLPERIAAWIEKVKARIALWWADTTAQLKTNLLMIWAIIVGKLYLIYLKVRTTLLMVWAIIVGKAYLIYLKVRTTLLMILAIILGQLLIWRQNLVDWWNRLVNVTIPMFFLKLKIKLKQKLALIEFWLKLKWLAAKLWVEGLVTTVTTLGEDIVAGFWQGLKNKWQAVKDWWAETFGGLGKQAEEDYDSHSPSRVFERIGESIPAGFARGLQKGFNLSGIQQRMSGLFGGMANAAAGVGLGAGGITVIQIGDMSLPGIRDGRDAGSFTEELTRLSDSADVRSQLPGGKMG